MEIIKLKTEHAQDVHSILASSFSNPWSLDMVSELLGSDSAVCFGAVCEDKLVGYACLEWVLDEGSLTDIAVNPDYRGRGFAKALMSELVSEAEKRDMQFVTLEVRESNISAVNLYRSFGFEDVGKRPRYYKDPVEDALLLTKYLK